MVAVISFPRAASRRATKGKPPCCIILYHYLLSVMSNKAPFQGMIGVCVCVLVPPGKGINFTDGDLVLWCPRFAKQVL
jgi:hypothetical protein